MKQILCILALFLMCGVGFSQTPTPEVRAAFAEQQLKVERARLDNAKTTITSLQREIAIKTAVFVRDRQDSERQAAADRAKIATLSVSLATANEELAIEKQRVVDLELQINKLTKERDKARSWKISFLRVFGIKRK
jgi:hypothetical protein